MRIRKGTTDKPDIRGWSLLKQHSRILSLLALLMVLCGTASAQTGSSEKNTYYLRHHLIFFADMVPVVRPKNIVFTERNICGFQDYVYESRILNRNSDVEIISIKRDKELARVSFRSAGRDYEIQLENSTKKKYRKSFKLVFSKKPVKERYSGKIKSWKDVIKHFGFPIALCISNNASTSWFYILEFSQEACNYDGCWIWFSERGLESKGYI